MGRYWGGSQFIMIPHMGGVVDQALLRAAAIYDPDHIYEYNFSKDELAKCSQEFAKSEPSDPEPHYSLRPPPSLLEATSIYRIEVEARPASGPVSMTAMKMGTMTQCRVVKPVAVG
jgi:hypothetical protein